MLSLFALSLAIAVASSSDTDRTAPHEASRHDAVRRVGPCDLLDRATVSALLGVPAPAGVPAGPQADDASSGTVMTCTFRAGSSALIISRVAFRNATAAREAATSEWISSRMGSDEVSVKEEAGLGQRAFWARTEHASQIMVLTGKNIISISVGGALPRAASTYENPLRFAASMALRRL